MKQMTSEKLPPHFFTGRWIGETQGYPMPAHIWEISQQGYGLMIATRWEGESKVMTFFGQLVSGEPAFIMPGTEKSSKAILIDKQHFVIAGWCTNDARGDVGPDYDVVFSRPGIAELTARQAYTRYLEQMAQAGN